MVRLKPPHRSLSPTHRASGSGRATCDTCRTRKRLRSAAQITERRKTLGTLELETQWLNQQLAQTANKLTSAEKEVAQLGELLRKHAPEALNKHNAALKRISRAGSDSSYQDSSPQSSNSLAPGPSTAGEGPSGAN